MQQHIHLVEFVENDNASTQEDGVIRDVLILGSKSRNFREYTAPAIHKAVPLYEGVAVFTDHPTATDRDRKGRSASDRFGVLRSVRCVESAAGPQIRGDLHYLTTHPLSTRVAEDQLRKLNFFGLSHLADGTGRTEKGITMVESIDKVTEVDLVTNPATAMSLREQAEMVSLESPPEKTPEEQAREDSERMARQAFSTGVESILVDPDLDHPAKLNKITELFKSSFAVLDDESEEPKAEQEAEGETAEAAKIAEQTTALASAINAALLPLTEQVTTLATELAAMKKAAKPGKYINPATQPPAVDQLALAEQAQTIPEDPKEKARWLHGRR